MYYLIGQINKIFSNFLLLRSKILSTILFIPILYIIGWILAKPFLLFSITRESSSFIGTIITFILFLITLPKWFKVRWRINNTWFLIGIKQIVRKNNSYFDFVKGFCYAFILLFLILIPLISNNWVIWLGKLSLDIIFNSILLTLGIGFAEELIFRGWLLEELKKQFGLKKAIIFQAFLFSIVHVGFDMPFVQMISILLGLFLLGILLAFRRYRDQGSIWGCVGLHGGLVGIWFILNNGLIDIYKNAPNWIVGPGNINKNPLGGIYGILILISLIIYYYYDQPKNLFKFISKK